MNARSGSSGASASASTSRDPNGSDVSNLGSGGDENPNGDEDDDEELDGDPVVDDDDGSEESEEEDEEAEDDEPVLAAANAGGNDEVDENADALVPNVGDGQVINGGEDVNDGAGGNGAGRNVNPQQPGNWLTFDQLMSETYPAKSKEIYLSAYRKFEIFQKSKKQFEPNVAPSETLLLNYFHHLRSVEKWQATSIWSQYSRLNGVLKRKFRLSMKTMPNVTDLLKSYEVGHRVKKANVFTPQQIEDMIMDPELTSRYWLVRKVVALVGYFGGMRNTELRSIEFGKSFPSGELSFESNQSGFWFTFYRGKQRGLPVLSTCCVPRRQADWTPTVSSSDRNPVDYDPASVIDLYLQYLELDLKKTRDQLSGPFFKSAHGKAARLFRQVPMGKNLIEKVGKEFAEELFLPNPATYTSHCWRRSAGTNASNAGVNVTMLMAHMGWNTPKTAIGYVQKSKLTSFNMSMLLSNVQRQNKDLDSVFDMLKKLTDRDSEEVVEEAKLPKKTKKSVPKLKPKIIPDVDVGAVNQFASALTSSRVADNSTRSPEANEVFSRNVSIVRSINETPDQLPDLDQIVQPVIAEVAGAVGGGGGNPAGLGGLGGLNFTSGSDLPAEFDHRISSILSNLSNHGQLHVHFHFGSK